MKHYYDENYVKFQVSKIEDYINEKVWKIYFDEHYDLIYIFIAKIRIISGDLDEQNQFEIY